MPRSPQPTEDLPSVADEVVSDTPHRTLVQKTIAHYVYQCKDSSQTRGHFPTDIEVNQINQHEAYILCQEVEGRESSSYPGISHLLQMEL